MERPIAKNVIDEVLAKMDISDISHATIRQCVAVANKLEELENMRFIHLEIGVPGILACPVGIEAQKKALDSNIAHEYPPIGGIPVLKQNASKFLKDLMEQSTKFLIRFAKSMPNLQIDEVKKEKIGDDLYRITAMVGNTGYLPTNVSDEAVKMGKAKTVKVSVKGGELISGKECTDIGHLSGYSRTKTGVFFYGNIGTHANAPARKKLEWIVKGKKNTKITVTAVSEKAGTVAKSIKL